MTSTRVKQEALLAYSLCKTGWAEARTLIDTAVRLLEHGADTPELRLMAGMNCNESPLDLREGFENVLRSLGVQSTDQIKETHVVVGHHLCQLALQQQLEPIWLMREMRVLWSKSDYDARFERWMRLDDAHDLLHEGYKLAPFEHLTFNNLEQVILQEAHRFLEEKPSAALLESNP